MNKKLRFSLLMLLMAVFGSGWAADSFSWDLSVASYSSASADQVVWESDYATMTADKASASTNANNYLGGDVNNRTSSRFYKGSTLTIAPESGYEIVSVAFSATSANYATALGTSTWSNATANVSGQTVTVTPTDGTEPMVATIGGTTGLTLVEVYYSEASSGKTPIATNVSFSPVEVDADSQGTFTLTADFVEGASYSVTWTSDNEDVIEVDNNGEYQANDAGTAYVTVTITPDNENSYKAVSKKLSVKVKAGTLANIAALTALTDGGTYDVALNNAIVTYTNGNYAYIQDESGAVVMYKNGHGLSAGDVLNGTATVTYQLRNSNPQITALSGVTPEAGTTTPEPTVVAPEEFPEIASVLSQWFKVTGASITKNGTKYYVDLNGQNVQLYGQGEATNFSLSDLNATYTIVGFPTLYNSTIELQIFEMPEMETSELPNVGTINGLEPLEMTVGDEGEFIVDFTPYEDGLTETADYTVAYTTSDDNTLSVNGKEYQAKAVGSVTVTVTVAAVDGDTYNDVTKDFTINIVEPVEFADMVYGCELYQKVTSNDQLEAGRRYLIVYDGDAPLGEGFEVFNGVNDSDLGKVVNFGNETNFANKIIDARGLSDITPVALQKSSDGKWYIQAEGQFLAYNKPAGTSRNNNLFSVEDYYEVGTLWTIDVEGSRLITNAYNDERSLQYNYNNGNPRFACYKSALSDVAIYKELLDVPVLNLSENDTEQQDIESGVYPIVNFTYAVKAGWNTVAMPFEGIDITDIMSDVKVYEFTGLSDEGDLNFSEFTGEFEPCKPYVFYSESETESNEHEFQDVNVIYEMGMSNEYFFSTLYRMPMAGLYGVVPSTGQIKKGGANSFIKGFRGYFDLPAESGDAVQAVFHNEDGTTTAIKAVELFNETNGNVYDLSGRKVSGNLQPGVYVKDGKKVVVK